MLVRETHVRNGPLTSIIPHQTWPRSHGTNTSNIYNAAPSPLLHSRYCRSNAQVYALDIDSKHLVELVFSHVKCRLVLVGCPCIVDELPQRCQQPLSDHMGITRSDLTISKPPNFSSAVLTSFSQSEETVTFAVTAKMEGLEPGGNCFSSVEAFMSAATTLPPSSTNLRAVARPKPDAAPMAIVRREGRSKWPLQSNGLAGKTGWSVV